MFIVDSLTNLGILILIYLIKYINKIKILQFNNQDTRHNHPTFVVFIALLYFLLFFGSVSKVFLGKRA